MSDKVKEFDEFFVKNYKYLVGFTKSIDTRHDYENTCHEVYLKCRDRIEANGYDGEDFLNYARCALMNNYKSQYRLTKKKQHVDFLDPDYYQAIEEILLQRQDFEQQEEERQHQNSYLNTIIFEYIEQRYSPKETFIFRTYFLLKHRHLNYKQLAESTGYSITSVSNIIKRMKKDIRENLKYYIVSGGTENGTVIN